MQVNRLELLAMLESVSVGLSQTSGVEHSDHFMFSKGMVSAFDGEVAAVATTPLELGCVLPAKQLLELTRRIPDESINVEVADGELLIRGENKKSGIRVEEATTMPVDCVEVPGEWRAIDGDLIAAMLLVGNCAASDSSQFVISCIHLTPTFVEASDRFQIGRRAVKPNVSAPCMVRASSVRRLRGIDLTHIAETAEWMHFRTTSGSLRVSIRKHADKFPELDTHLQISGTTVSLPHGSAIDGMVSRASVFFVNEPTKLLTVELRPGKMRITGRGSRGWYSETKQVNYKGEEVTFAVSSDVLLEVFHKTDKVTISDGKQRKLFVDVDGFQFAACTGQSKGE